MQRLEVTAHCDCSADEAFERIADFESHADHSDAVLAVRCEHGPGRDGVSDWEVRFRTGILLWTERDSFDRAAGTIEFEKIEGDPDHFAGRWTVSEEPGGARIDFAADFQLGINAFSEIFDPLAERALHDNVVSILRGKFGDRLRIAGAPTASAAP